MSEALCMWLRSGTSKGAYFLAQDLPDEDNDRQQFLLGIMGSPDPRQIDGMGGANPLTSKVAIVRKSQRDDADVDYHFFQVFVDQPIVSDAQNCGNILAGVAPFAIERGLVTASDDVTEVRIHMQNTGQLAIAKVRTPGKKVVYTGTTAIDGVPGTGSPISLRFSDTAGANCGALLPTGNPIDFIDGIQVTCIDNGMPVVILRASDFGLQGNEPRELLEQNQVLKAKLESIRLQAGILMNLGDVKEKSVPKMTLVSAAQYGGTLMTRTFIPHRCHAAIGVFGAISVATAATLPNSVAFDLASTPSPNGEIRIEHPSGATRLSVEPADTQTTGSQQSIALVLTARKLFDGTVYSR